MMARKHETGSKKMAATPNARRETYRGHEITIPDDHRRKRIFIDGRQIKWGKAGDSYFLDVYAYDPGKTLDETIKRYIDFLEKASNAGKDG